MEDRSRMVRRKRGCLITSEFVNRVRGFLDFAFSKPDFMDGNMIKCLCTRCKNQFYLSYDDVELHLINRGFDDGYTNWYIHGEPWISMEVFNAFVGSSSSSNCMEPIFNNVNSVRGMVMNVIPMNDPYFYLGFQNMDFQEEPNPQAAKFFETLKAADEPLWDGCTRYSKLSYIAWFLTTKSLLQISEYEYNTMTDIIKKEMPDGEKLAENYYEAKKMMQPLGLYYEKIHMCPNFCILYYGDDVEKLQYDVCEHPRYRPLSSKRCGFVACKVLRYFLLSPQLQRWYFSKQTVEHITWHDSHQCDDRKMSHPFDGLAWKEFNKLHPEFASEP